MRDHQPQRVVQLYGTRLSGCMQYPQQCQEHVAVLLYAVICDSVRACVCVAVHVACAVTISECSCACQAVTEAYSCR